MYDSAAQFQPGRATTAPSSKVELSISCKNLRNRDLLSKSDPMCVIFMKDFGGSRFYELGRTETLNNTLNPEFEQKILIDYRFEEAQGLKFEIYDVDVNTGDLSRQDFLGRMECTLGEIVGASGGKIHKNLTGLPGSNLGSIIVSAYETESSKEIFIMQWRGEKLDKKDFLGKSDPFIQIYRIDDDRNATMVHRTEVCKNTLNPVWKPFRIPINKLSLGNMNRSLRFDVYDWDSDGGQAHDLIGIFETTVSKLKEMTAASHRVFELINPSKKAKKKDYKNSGTMHLTSISVETEYSFLDYVRGGTQLNFTVAIDFTASNGNPLDPSSLHYINPNIPNAYMIALKAVGEICQDYDSDKMFPALGFGAKLPPNGIVSHEFFLNFHPTNPHCYKIDGVLEAYKRCLMSIQLYGPTNFSPVINHVARIASGSTDGSNYFVLLIVTDGVISDMENTIASIVNASYLPMSIIIVGVGNADFSAMDFLDSDKGVLAIQGRRAERDIVQFVPMNKYLSGGGHCGNVALSQAQLAKDVLYEIPTQLISYMQKRGIKPKPPVQINVPPVMNNVDTPPGHAHGQPSMPPPPPQGGPQVGGQPQYPPAPHDQHTSYPPLAPHGSSFPPQQSQQQQHGAYPPPQQGYPSAYPQTGTGSTGGGYPSTYSQPQAGAGAGSAGGYPPQPLSYPHQQQQQPTPVGFPPYPGQQGQQGQYGSQQQASRPFSTQYGAPPYPTMGQHYGK